MDDDSQQPDDAPPGRAAERPVPDGPFLNGARPTANGGGTSSSSSSSSSSDEVTISVTIGSAMADVERDVILATLRHYNHHKERVAAVLGISLKTLYNRLKEYAAQDAARAHGPHD
jgi:DNA-binding NtrC family response regulator